MSTQIVGTLSPSCRELWLLMSEKEAPLPSDLEKDHIVVKYALAGISNQLFVSRYQVALPTESELRGLLDGVLA